MLPSTLAMSEDNIPALVRTIASEAKQASRALAAAGTAQKNAVLRRVIEALRGAEGQVVLDANERDMGFAQDANLSAAMLDRLRLDKTRLLGIAGDLEAVLRLPDPVGQVDSLRKLESGISAGRMSVPLGVIAMIYESRPNVTADAAALCIKSGNACVLRGGKEAFHSAQALTQLFETSLSAEGLPKAAVSLLPTTLREATLTLLSLDDLIDLAIPRGGEGLIRFVVENARVPVIKHYKGVCHVYVDATADYIKAERILVNAKVQRPSACNAAETLLVDRAIASQMLPGLCKAVADKRVELRGCDETRALFPRAKPVTEVDFDTEYTDYVLNVRVVDGLEGALAHIARHGTLHTEAIVTENYAHAQRFLREVDASAVLVNASTRFNDGAQLGLGSEIGISTSKLHAYGPMGLNELCTKKWVVYGDGQIRA
jgi:glutamate-5-semialdehyde dehydrogenase